MNNNLEWNRLLNRVCQLVNKESGNILGDRQQNMVANRLKTRMSDIKIKDCSEYRNYLEKNLSSELKSLVSLITTHHTFFFREFLHFDFLKEKLPEIINRVRNEGKKKITFWSAACSRGHEVYSLAMFLNYHLQTLAPDLDFSIFGSDIDSESVQFAQNAVYNWNDIKSAPKMYIEGNWQRGKGSISDFVKVKNELKSKCHFKTINLIKNNEWPSENFDIIFCRNVFIYFEKEVVEKLSEKFLQKLSDNGYFFTGISESLAHYDVKMNSVGVSVYQKSSAVTNQKQGLNKSPAVKPMKMINVLCVDDSPSMLKIYSKILTKENGFNIVATAVNGEEAHKVLQEQKIDALTLDIHMPVMNGIEYLEKYYNYSHPPVVIISSVSRSDSGLALRALSLGVSDFVEKPELKNMNQTGDEIRTKIKVALIEKTGSHRKNKNLLDKSFAKDVKITKFDDKLQCLVASSRDLVKIEKYFKEFLGDLPETTILFHGQKSLFEQFKSEVESKLQISCKSTISNKLSKGEISIMHVQEYLDKYSRNFGFAKVAFLIYGRISSSLFSKISRLSNPYILLEDLNVNTGEDYIQKVNELTPATSYAYILKKYFAG